jgi:Secretion system C-terminal sorting domain/WD40-like Beta Propeller Repeat
LKKLLSLIFLLIHIIIKPQIHPPAVEVWSEPIRVDSLSDRFIGEWSPSLTTDLSSLYLEKSGSICVSHKVDSIWTSPIALNNNINNGNPIRHPSSSEDGKRLYFCRWGGYGGWDLWYSEWDSIANDWGTSINLGPNVNSSWIEYYAYELSKDTLYCVNQVWASLGVCIYVKDSLSGEWQIVDSSNYYHPFGEGDIRGLSITGDRRKAYFSKYISLISDSLQSELYVTFWDSVQNHWGDVFELNINSNAYQPDTTNNFHWIGGWDEYPTISPDGKLMFFMSNRDAAREDTIYTPDIYMSLLLIDENGNPVGVDELPDIGSIVNDFLLLQNYPNPFNPSTNIKFYLPESDQISLTVYDILGNEIIRAIDNQSYNSGWQEYKADFSNKKLASGIYFYTLKVGQHAVTKKMILLR